MNWAEKFRAISGDGEQTASFGAVATPAITIPSGSFDSSRVPRPLFVLLGALGVGVMCVASYSLGEQAGHERYERHLAGRGSGASGVRKRHLGSLKGHALREVVERSRLKRARDERALDETARAS